jgi:hypothetical protein
VPVEAFGLDFNLTPYNKGANLPEMVALTDKFS